MPPPFPSHLEILAELANSFDSQIASGSIRPFIYPWDSAAAGILILYLFFFPSICRLRLINACHLTSRVLKICIFGVVAVESVRTISKARSLGMANGYGIGLACMWCIIWTGACMVGGGREGFKRVERVRIRKARRIKAGEVNGSVKLVTEELQDGALRRRKLATDEEVESVGGEKEPEGSHEPDLECNYEYCYVWQPLPEQPLHRLEWVLDLVTNFRGPGWNWKVPSLPPLPSSVQEDLNLSSEEPWEEAPLPITPHPDALPYSTIHLLLINLLTFTLRYLAIDILKVVMMADPYFLGLVAPTFTPSPSFPYRLIYPSLIATSPILLKTTRLAISLLGVYLALTYIFTLGPLFFILALRPLHPYLSTPFAEPWLYPALFGPLSAVLDTGLAGAWSVWWHQMFRFGITAPSTFLVQELSWNPKSAKARTVQLFTAFALSGSIHACASYTQYAPSWPLGPFCFFILQAVGIMLQTLFIKALLPRLGLSERSFIRSRGATRTSNAVFVAIWFYFTGPLFADDVAGGGIWLFEPVPISVVRGLGFGLKEEGWWCWGREGGLSRWLGWYWDREGRWWRSGIAI